MSDTTATGSQCDCECCDCAPVTLEPIHGPEEPGGFEAAMTRFWRKASEQASRAFDDAILYGILPPALRSKLTAGAPR